MENMKVTRICSLCGKETLQDKTDMGEQEPSAKTGVLYNHYIYRCLAERSSEVYGEHICDHTEDAWEKADEPSYDLKK